MKDIISQTFLGMPLVAWGGIVVLCLLFFQILVGTRVIKIDIKYHTYIAWTLLVTACIHGLAALIYIFG